MPLQPGPFHLLDATAVHVASTPYNFADDASELQGDLAAIGAGWDDSLTDIENFAAGPWDAEMNLDFAGTLAAIDQAGSNLPPDYMNDVITNWFDAQTLLDAATSFAPTESWTDPPGPFIPPDSTLTLIPPTIDPNLFTPAPNQTVGGTTEGRSPAVGLFNVTRYGSQNFTVGDQFEVVALGVEGDAVSVNSTFNSEVLPPVFYGPIDSTGQMFIKGTIGPEAKGVWSEQWYINGLIMGSFNFIVTD